MDHSETIQFGNIMLVWEEGKAGVLESLKGKKEDINNRLGLPPTPPQTWNV